MKKFLAVSQITALLLLNFNALFAQSVFTVEGIVKSTLGNSPLPFVQIQLEGGENHAFADIDGRFRVACTSSPCQLTFTTPQHRSVTLLVERNSERNAALEVLLPQHQVFQYETETSGEAFRLMQKVIDRAATYNPANRKDFQYKTYNKLTLNAGNTEKVRNLFQRAIDAFDFVNERLLAVSDSQHLLLSESVTQRKYLNPVHQKETILHARLTSIENPALLTINSAIQPFSMYDAQVNIAGKDYYSPLMPQGLKWYYFTITDTVQLNQEKVYVVKFHPWWKKRIAFLKGYLYINASDYSLRYVFASPTMAMRSEVRFSQSYQKVEEKSYFPDRTKTGVYQQSVGSGKLNLNVESSSILFGLETQQKFRRRDFDEVILDYNKEGQNTNEGYWQSVRQGTFTAKDSATLVFFDSVGTIPNFDRFIRLGEGVYYGELPARKINLNLRKIVNYNQFEGLRIGFGARTNERLIQFASFGGYFGFGLKDALLKYGINADFTLYRPADVLLRFNYKHDLEEAGGIPLTFQENQFPSEPVRNLHLGIFDRVEEKSASLQFRMLKNLQIEGAFSEREIYPQYNYAFVDTTTQQFTTNELRLAFRYAHGERYLQSLFRKISLGTSFPIVWFQWRLGNARWGSDYKFHRFDMQVRKSFELLGLGKAFLQGSAGLVRGKVPYSLLYNGKGSYRNFAAIAHNSFETMNYNEFLSDRYFALFYSHNFGNIYIRKFKKQPSVEMLHHIGFGALRNPEEHFNFPFKTMEKGYFESGLFMNNIIVLKAPGIQTGLGAGAFVRYGPYHLPQFSDNILFKLAVDFQL